MDKRQVKGIAALIAASGLCVGVCDAQPLVIDWLAPATGLWSDPSNWAGGNVPDSLDEAARISPPEARGIGSPAALVDGDFEVDELTGNGLVDVVIQDGFLLGVGSLIDGEEDGIGVIVGDDSASAAPATLELIGTSRGTSTFISNASITLNGENSEVISQGRTSLGDDVFLTGNGRVIGEYTNFGTIGSVPGGTLTFADAEVGNVDGIISGEGTVRFESSTIRLGSILHDVVFDDAVVTDVAYAAGSGLVETRSTFRDVSIGEAASLIVDDLLSYTATTGEFFNAGQVVINGFGRVRFDDTPENTLILGEGVISLTDDNGGLAVLQAQEDDEVFVLPDAVIEGQGRVVGDVINLGTFDATLIDVQSPEGTLEVLGDFTQLGLGEVIVGVAQRFQPSLADVEVQRLQINSGDVLLGGDLVVRYLVLEPELIAGVPFRVVQHRNPNGVFAFDGEFDRVSIAAVPAALSPIPQVDYNDADVSVTLFCLADVNRNAFVDGQDFGAWILAYNQRDPLADQNQDGSITPADFNAWIDNFNGGCGR